MLWTSNHWRVSTKNQSTGIALLIYSTRRFNDDIFTLKVGSAEQVFMVHKSILRLSPVLACMTTSSFSEGIAKEIALPEDDEDSFGRILEHLYGNNDAAFDIQLQGLDGAEKLADVYGLAEKYQLPDVQDRVIQKLKQLDVLKQNRKLFFRIARQICQTTRDSDTVFDSYFAQQAAEHLKSMSQNEVDWLSEMLCSGGSFASKIFQVQADTYRKSQGAVAEGGLRMKIIGITNDLEKAKRMHKSQHPSCYQCHVLQ